MGLKDSEKWKVTIRWDEETLKHYNMQYAAGGSDTQDRKYMQIGGLTY